MGVLSRQLAAALRGAAAGGAGDRFALLRGRVGWARARASVAGLPWVCALLTAIEREADDVARGFVRRYLKHGVPAAKAARDAEFEARIVPLIDRIETEGEVEGLIGAAVARGLF